MRIAVVVPVTGAGKGVGIVVEGVRSAMASVEGAEVHLVLVDSAGTDDTPLHVDALLPTWRDVDYVGLSRAADEDEVFLAGMENAPPADAVILFDPRRDDPSLLAPMAVRLAAGADLVVARMSPPLDGFAYRAGRKAFSLLDRLLGGAGLSREAGRFRGMSRRVVAHVTSHDDAAIGHRVIPFLVGFRAEGVGDGRPAPTLLPPPPSRGLSDGLRRGLSLVAVSSDAPLRVTSGLCLLGALASLVFSAYAAAVYLLNDEVAPGWTTLSFQLNALFAMLSLAVFALSEYVLAMGRKGRRGYRLLSSRRSPSSLEAPNLVREA